jgi:hypothetical protein
MPSKDLLERFRQGVEIGKLAWQLFPNGTDLSPASAFPSAIIRAAEKTAEQLSRKNTIIYEASFIRRPTLAILDILVKENEKLFAYEVKSSVDISQTYIRDMAFQYYVMKASGYCPEDFFIIHLNEGYESTSTAIECLRITKVTEEILELQPYIEENIRLAVRAVTDDTLLKIQQGDHCYVPYPCDFMGYCSRNSRK